VAEAVNAILDPRAGLVAVGDWPVADGALLVKDEVTIAVQVNGKLRGTVTVTAGAEKDAVLAVAREAVTGALKEVTVVKEIFVPDRIVNFVVRG
jgi:leucyl-tRNA synthetase